MEDENAMLLARFAAVDTAAVSDALDGLGLPGALGGISPMWGHPKVVGFASTVELESVTSCPPGVHIAAAAVDVAGPRDVLVIANQGRMDVSCWGGLLSLGASLRGVRGVIADGACRDVGEARELRFPVFARGCIPVTARGRLRQRSAGEPVRIGGHPVAPGDIVMADDTGVAFISRARARKVLDAAEAIAGREHAIAADLRTGTPPSQAMRDARLAGHEEHH